MATSYLPGSLIVLDLDGDEYVQIDNGGSVDVKTTTTAIAQLAASIITTGVIVLDLVTENATPVTVAGLPVIPATGGYCWLQGTIVAQDQTTRDMAVWNIAVASNRTNGAGSCTTQGDTTPSIFTQEGTTSGCSVTLGAGASGSVITLTGISDNVTWGINLNFTAGD